MSFTPGPWFGMINGRFADTEWIAENDEAQVSASAPITDNEGVTVALVVSEKWSDDELDANARLIAAAPELLEALETIAGLYDHEASSGENSMKLYDARSIALAVIAKARGEGV